MRGVEAGDAQEGAALLAQEGYGLLSYEGRVRDFVRCGKGNGVAEVLARARQRMLHFVLDAHRTFPDIGPRRQANADVVDLLRRDSAHPGLISVFVHAGFIRYFEMVEAVGGMRTR